METKEYELAGIETIARGVCVMDGKVLLCRAKGGKSSYLPGGHIEFGETGRQALVREVKEELGVASSAGAFLGAAENYFMQHPDVNITSLAANLAIDRHQLGKNFQPKEREGGLRQHVLHLVLDLRLDIIEKRLKDIQQQLRQAGSDMERVKELLEEYKDTQQLRDALAKQLGNDLVR